MSEQMDWVYNIQRNIYYYIFTLTCGLLYLLKHDSSTLRNLHQLYKLLPSSSSSSSSGVQTLWRKNLSIKHVIISCKGIASKNWKCWIKSYNFSPNSWFFFFNHYSLAFLAEMFVRNDWKLVMPTLSTFCLHFWTNSASDYNFFELKFNQSFDYIQVKSVKIIFIFW